MSRIEWNQNGSYENGISHGIFFKEDGFGVPWRGLVRADLSFTSDSGKTYYDGELILSSLGSEETDLVINAFTCPNEMFEYEGQPDFLTAQEVRFFALSFRTNREIHFFYNALATPNDQVYETVDGRVSADDFSWAISTVPMAIPGGLPSAHLVVDLESAKSSSIENLENLIYGTESSPSRLPSIDELIDMFENSSIFVVIDHGDGTWTAIGPDDMIEMIDETTFSITSPSATYLDPETYTLSSY